MPWKPKYVSPHRQLFHAATASIVLLASAACGGIETNPGASARQPTPDPSVTDPPPAATAEPITTTARDETRLARANQWRDNPTAQDTHDHWDNPAPLGEQLGLSPVPAAAADERKRAIQALLTNAAVLPADEAGTLRTARLDSISILGERDGITYAQWTAGPAGTLQIEFDFRHAPSLDGRYRAALERAGKLWSYRIVDRFDSHQQRIRDFNVNTDGLFIAVYTKPGEISEGRPLAHNTTAKQRYDFEPWFGEILIARHALAQSDKRMSEHMNHTAMHEVGHVLGFEEHTNRQYWEPYVDREANTWHGPNAVAANEGEPVPFQWLSLFGQPVPPHLPGSTRDLTHLGVCSSVMAYCGFPFYSPSPPLRPTELDVAYLADIGYEILDAATAARPELRGYGAWGNHSAWGASVERLIVHNRYQPHDQLRATADAFGSPPSRPLTESSLSGEVTWTGSLIGVDLGSSKLPPVAGDSELRVDIATLQGTAAFSNLTVHADGRAEDFRAPSLEYQVTATDNRFSDTHNRVQGGFFGPSHEEMAGVVNDASTTVSLLAAFGGTQR